MAFDIVQQDYSKAAQNGYEFELLFPDGKRSDAFLTVVGDMAPEVQNYIKRVVNDRLRKERLPKKTGREEIPTVEGFQEDNVEAALVRLVSWKGIKENGKDVPFSKDKAREIMTAHNWIATQIMEASSEVSNFTPKPTKA